MALLPDFNRRSAWATARAKMHSRWCCPRHCVVNARGESMCVLICHNFLPSLKGRVNREDGESL